VTRAHALSYALNPESIAVVGASDHPNKVGGRPIAYLQKYGYKGRIYPINPNRPSVQGFIAFPDLAALPEVPDLAIVATPAINAVETVGRCAERGVKAAIVMASGFGETTDPAAIRAERQMAAYARDAGMRLFGPNCQGLANIATGAIASFSTIFFETEPCDGPVAIISQSGVMSAVPYGLLRARGIGVRHAHATGNEADVTLAELASVVLDDPAVRLLLLYMEAIRDPDALAAAAEKARRRGVPIVAVKSGRTPRGRAAARTHTGAPAMNDRVVDAFFRKHAIWRVRDIQELVAATELYLKGWRPRGRRLVAISNSGATCVMAADSAPDVRLELATLQRRTISRLSEMLPSFATVTNPIDVTAALLSDSGLFGRILDAVSADPSSDLIFIGLPIAGEGYDVKAFARDAARLIERKKPVVLSTPLDKVAAVFRAAGVPAFANDTEAIRALAQVTHHAELMQRASRKTRRR
jgi:acyl-CoA synthetase (NDP forming)